MSRKLTIYYTSDTHGYFFPTDFLSPQWQPMGVYSMAFPKDGNTLILDGGDTLQGSPLSCYCGNSGLPEVAADAFNTLGCDYFTLGNHDFDYGPSYTADFIRKHRGTCLCANIHFDSTDSSNNKDIAVLPYTIHTLENGLRIGIVGICSDWLPRWTKQENLEGITVTNTLEAARIAVEELKSQHPDFLIGLYHGGMEKNPLNGQPINGSEGNIGCRLCEELPLDLLLAGHQHTCVTNAVWHGTHIVQPGSDGKYYARIELDEDGGYSDQLIQPDIPVYEVPDSASAVSTSASSVSTSVSSVSTSVSSVSTSAFSVSTPASSVSANASASMDNTPTEHKESIYHLHLSDDRISLWLSLNRWLDTPAGRLSTALLPEDKLYMATHGSSIADFFNLIQLEASHADISCTSLANTLMGFQQDVTVRDVVSSYPYSNTLVVKQVTGTILKMALEHCADYFDHAPDGSLIIADTFVHPVPSHFNYDYFAGITYTIDPDREPGHRVTGIFFQGQPVKPEDTFSLCMNSYRAAGTGGYSFYADCPTLEEIPTEVRNLIIDYLLKHPYVELPPTHPISCTVT